MPPRSNHRKRKPAPRQPQHRQPPQGNSPEDVLARLLADARANLRKYGQLSPTLLVTFESAVPYVVVLADLAETRVGRQQQLFAVGVQVAKATRQMPRDLFFVFDAWYSGKLEPGAELPRSVKNMPGRLEAISIQRIQMDAAPEATFQPYTRHKRPDGSIRFAFEKVIGGPESDEQPERVQMPTLRAFWTGCVASLEVLRRQDAGEPDLSAEETHDLFERWMGEDNAELPGQQTDGGGDFSRA